MSEQECSLLSLKWNNHASNFKFTISQLQETNIFSDAMLACDGKFYPVHKFVLATCSEYFGKIFEKMPCKHPVIILKDISSKDVEFLLSYMYNGEVSVNQTDLPDLIKSAETLQIKGLAAPDDPPPQSSSQGVKHKVPNDSSEKSPKRQRTSLSSNNLGNLKDIKKEPDESYFSNNDEENIKNLGNHEQDIVEYDKTDPSNVYYKSPTTEASSNFQEENDVEEIPLPIKLENDDCLTTSSLLSDPQSRSSDFPVEEEALWPSILNSASGEILTSPNSTDSHLYPSESPDADYGFNNQRRNTLEASTHGAYLLSKLKPRKCTLCDYVAPLYDTERFGNRNHASHLCKICLKRFQSNADIVRHMRTHTGEKPYRCPHCDYRSALKGNLKSHVVVRHSDLNAIF